MLRHSDASFLFLLHFLGGLVVQLERSNHQLLHGPHARQRPPPSLGAACRDACQRFFRRRRCRGRRGRPSQGRGHVLSFSVPGPTLHQRTPMESGAVEGVPQKCVRCVLTWRTPTKPRSSGCVLQPEQRVCLHAVSSSHSFRDCRSSAALLHQSWLLRWQCRTLYSAVPSGAARPRSHK